MPKIKLILTFLVLLITSIIFYKHFINNEFIRSAYNLVILIIMVFGLWILPEATEKLRKKMKKNKKLINRRAL